MSEHTRSDIDPEANIDWLAVARQHVNVQAITWKVRRCLRYRRVPGCDCRVVRERNQLRVECSRHECDQECWLLNQELATASADAVRQARRCAELRTEISADIDNPESNSK